MVRELTGELPEEDCVKKSKDFEIKIEDTQDNQTFFKRRSMTFYHFIIKKPKVNHHITSHNAVILITKKI